MQKYLQKTLLYIPFCDIFIEYKLIEWIFYKFSCEDRRLACQRFIINLNYISSNNFRDLLKRISGRQPRVRSNSDLPSSARNRRDEGGPCRAVGRLGNRGRIQLSTDRRKTLGRFDRRLLDHPHRQGGPASPSLLRRLSRAKSKTGR